MGYYFWDDISKQLVHEWNMIFNEKAIYMDCQYKGLVPRAILEEDDPMEDVVVPSPIAIKALEVPIRKVGEVSP